MVINFISIIKESQRSTGRTATTVTPEIQVFGLDAEVEYDSDIGNTTEKVLGFEY